MVTHAIGPEFRVNLSRFNSMETIAMMGSEQNNALKTKVEPIKNVSAFNQRIIFIKSLEMHPLKIIQ